MTPSLESIARNCRCDDAPCASCLTGATCEGPRECLPWLPGDDVPEVSRHPADRLSNGQASAAVAPFSIGDET